MSQEASVAMLRNFLEHPGHSALFSRAYQQIISGMQKVKGLHADVVGGAKEILRALKPLHAGFDGLGKAR
jgi:hypothetical protein